MKVSCVYFPEKERAAFKTEEMDGTLTGSEVLVKADYDLISAGTELANYHDLPNTNGPYPDNHTYPRYVGYSVSGHVVAIGPDVKNLKPGDNVVVPWSGHRSWFKKPEDTLFKITEKIDQKIAAFAHLASFPFLGVRKLQIQLGESVMVAGLGILGLIAIQAAKLSGAYPVLACDYSPERRALALKLGADYVLDPQEPDFMEQVAKLTDGKGPAATVEVTGYLSGLQQALRYTATMGRVSLLGCTRISDEPINVYKFIHAKGIQLIGAHTITRPYGNSYPGFWTEKDDYATFVKLVKFGKLQIEPIVNRVADPRDAEEIYHTIGFMKNPPFGILLDWTKIDAE